MALAPNWMLLTSISDKYWSSVLLNSYDIQNVELRHQKFIHVSSFDKDLQVVNGSLFDITENQYRLIIKAIQKMGSSLFVPQIFMVREGGASNLIGSFVLMWLCLGLKEFSKAPLVHKRVHITLTQHF